ncbi:glycolate oxidase [Desulfonispora thiosulfatigenes DSM 11270]|uniref:Glycolate oxidase n=1 Tax=Desulfonispora thiosulfatigenes DSM 11270 TaxID=656914 RepID=A0A1W1UKC9_DESTI|nr:FAD-linked oxidase C-terminal domain-containing protein [Desulfonispora thiosulfatigenes]SMB81502.1 glycolate oxidase [Desulfonispora thiosulfatigenes DSM 11270]
MLDKKLKTILTKIVGLENIITNKLALETYSYDASPYQGEPMVVLFPSTTEMVAEIVKVADKYDIPIMPRGAGTSVSGGAVPPKRSIVLSFTRMNRILDINSIDRTALVEVGLTNKQLQLATKKYDLMFAPDPASQNISTIGGNIAENAGGIKGVKYGSTRDHVLGLEVVLPTGEIIKTGNLSSEILPEVDLTYVFCGSEGTFGIVTKACLSLSRLNPSVETMTSTFNSIEDAGNCVAQIIASGVIPTTMEIMDNTVIRAVEEHAKLGLPKKAAAFLLVEVDGFPTETNFQVTSIMRAFKANLGYDYKLAKDEKEREELWTARRSVNGALGKLKPANISHDIVVPRDRIATMLKKIAQIGDEYQIIIGQVAHAGDGNLHPSLYYDHRIPEEVLKVEKACDKIIKETFYQGGSLSGEHGIGLEKKKYMVDAYSKTSLKYMKKIKDAFDPKGLLNADKVLPDDI